MDVLLVFHTRNKTKRNETNQPTNKQPKALEPILLTMVPKMNNNVYRESATTPLSRTLSSIPSHTHQSCVSYGSYGESLNGPEAIRCMLCSEEGFCLSVHLSVIRSHLIGYRNRRTAHASSGPNDKTIMTCQQRSFSSTIWFATLSSVRHK